MWDCCFIQLYSYGKLPYEIGDQRATERNLSREAYDEILQKVWARDNVDLRYTAPRAWPPFPCFTEEEFQQASDTHYSVHPLKAFSDYAIKLVQRLLYYTASE